MTLIERLGLAIDSEAPLPNRPIRVLGIDLGTTNSTVCEMTFDPKTRDVTIAEPITIEQTVLGETIRGALVPSVVAVVNGQAVVGHSAARFRAAPAEFHLREDATLFAETKNVIGIGKTYHEAPEGFRTPGEIAGHVLSALYKEATTDKPADRVVVTVPASFETRQRDETVRGASLAGIDLAPGDLLDEPVSIFVESMLNGSCTLSTTQGTQNVLVFDFGGGTCDVAVIAVTFAPNTRPQISPLAVSRYHRLGGGDIDRAIVYEELIPQLLAQNELDRHALTYDEKRYALEPALVPIAESLKLELSSDTALDAATVARTITIEHEGHVLRLKNPILKRERFVEILAPFVDREMTWESGNEYRTQRSIFAPIEDALNRAGLGMDEIGTVLLGGGSSLIPEIGYALEDAFGPGVVETYTDPEDAQTAVARGAACHAMALELFGRGMVRPTVHDAISIQTSTGLVEIVPQGTELPFPKKGQWHSASQLLAPESRGEGALELRVEVVAGNDRGLLESRIWSLPAPVCKGDSLEVLASMDENKLLQVMLVPFESDANPFSLRIENPVTHVVNPGEVRSRIEETERALDDGTVPQTTVTTKLKDLGRDYAKIGHREKALDRYQRAMKRLGRPDADILLCMGIIAGELGDEVRQEKYYLQAAALNPKHSASLFNLALAKFERNELDEAQGHVTSAIERSADAPYYVLKARILQRAGDEAGCARALTRAEEEFAPVETLDGYELFWFERMASMKGDAELVERAKAARRKLSGSKAVTPASHGVLPDRAGRSTSAASGSVN